MRKIGIITYPDIEDGKGRFLQAYALYSAIKEMGYSPEILNYVPAGFERTFSAKRILKTVFREPAKIYGYFLAAKGKIFNILQKKKKQAGKLKYKAFINKNMDFASEHVLTADDLKQMAGQYDAFVCGSDQIWNPYFSCGQDENYYLKFAPYEKRIAYAASMGTVQIEDTLLQESVKKISGLRYCSVREPDTKKLLSKWCDFPVTQVCDPTFLMDRVWWDNLAAAPRLKVRYVLTFLFDNNPEPRKMAHRIAREKGLKVVSIQEGLGDVFRNTLKLSGLGPEEFVSLFKNAEYICTQSFHGTVLSLIFNKEFFVFDRSEGGQVDGLIMRISNLLREVGLEERIIRKGSAVSAEKIDYKKIEERLSAQRQRSKQYLSDALKNVCEEE